MSPWIVLRIAWLALARHKLRSSLTVLGIIVGVGAVICAVSIGDGAAMRIQESIQSQGTNVIWIEPGSRNAAGVRTGNQGARNLTADDIKAIAENVPAVAYASPSVDTRVQVVYGDQNWNTQVRGVSADYLDIRNWPLSRGTVFDAEDVASARLVCVLGQTVASTLFGGDTDPIGQTIRVRNLLCSVIGVLAVKGASPGGQSQDDTVLMPYTTVMKQLTGQTWLDDAYCSTLSASDVDVTEGAITAFLRDRHRIAPDQPADFNLRHPLDLAQAAEQSAKDMAQMLGGIASVSLIVGGIGVMNIMLVSVTERTREIGLRLSIGARAQDVRRQFLIEAVLLSLAGGALGVAAGVLASDAVANLMQWQTSISTAAIGIAFLCAAATGIVFGYYPAMQASRLDPIDALRHD